ncbi:MAG TPA: NAD-dependent epimerase/dehydratase family protein [Opitutaceae bacterium]|nr:NAD-dependent epimerase/dehydratase family protein [Opitutaceae bacterium]
MAEPLTALVTGASGFIARHLILSLERTGRFQVLRTTRATPSAEQASFLRRADIVYHLAGVNRPPDPAEFATGNAGLTQALCQELAAAGRRPLLVLASSVQAALDNPYGRSKSLAEQHVAEWVRATGGGAVVCRLKNVFGKWCRPNYNSVTATFCHNLARGRPIEISDPARELELVYIDDVVATLLDLASALAAAPGSHLGQLRTADVPRSFRVTLGALAQKIEGFRRSRDTLLLDSFADDFTRCLYATYLSYLEPAAFAYPLLQRSDQRGSLAEFIKQPAFGQVFISRTAPGITRGNHYHDTKTEKFLVVQGRAIIRFRPVLGGEVVEHHVDGREFRVVDIPPGYTHSIENVGPDELVTLFWASEIFDPARPDTYLLPVLPAPPTAPQPASAPPQATRL